MAGGRTRKMDARTRQTVKSTVNYIQRLDEPLYTYRMVDPPEGKPATNEVYDPRPVEITSVRDGAAMPQLDVNGFELVDFTPLIEDIYDPRQLEEDYYPQVIDLVKRHTGASEVRV